MSIVHHVNSPGTPFITCGKTEGSATTKLEDVTCHNCLTYLKVKGLEKKIYELQRQIGDWGRIHRKDQVALTAANETIRLQDVYIIELEEKLNPKIVL